MRKHLRRYIPSHEAVRRNRWLAVFGESLLHPRLWHLNRHSTAGAVAVGLFCGLIPGPLQMLGAALACLLWRVNLPLALVVTFYTNPLTIVPLYLVAYQLGSLVFPPTSAFVAPPEFAPGELGQWVMALADWVTKLGKPLALGILLLAALLATTGYLAVRSAYRFYLVRAWQRRRAKRARSSPR
jgi:hypothetical protein